MKTFFKTSSGFFNKAILNVINPNPLSQPNPGFAHGQNSLFLVVISETRAQLETFQELIYAITWDLTAKIRKPGIFSQKRAK